MAKADLPESYENSKFLPDEWKEWISDAVEDENQVKIAS